MAFSRFGVSDLVLSSLLCASVVAPDADPFASKGSAQSSAPERRDSRNAYLTLVSGPKWILGARTLAQSMSRVGCKWPRIMLLTFVPKEHLQTELESELWDVRVLPRMPNPFGDDGEMTRNTFSMLWAYNFSDFSKIIYIDSDFLVMKNLDHLFDCGDWCAAVSGRESNRRFNAGLQVLTPDEKLFQNLVAGSRSGEYHSYNRGVQGFLNEAIPVWCTHGKAHSWAEVEAVTDTAAGVAGQMRRCRTLSATYNHIAVLIKDGDDVPASWWPPSWQVPDLYSDPGLMALHYNHPSFWAIKPWLWWWYPLLPSNWIWWQIRREVAGEAWRAAVVCCAGVFIPLFVSCVFVLTCPAWLLKMIHGVVTLEAAMAAKGSKLALGCCKACLQHHLSRALSMSVVASLLVFMLIPSQEDALIAWACYFTMKGCVVGLWAFGLAAADVGYAHRPADKGHLRRGTRRSRLPWVVCGYTCELAEAAVIWLPQCLGAQWLSDKKFVPFCSFDGTGLSGRLYHSFGCNVVVWFVIAWSALFAAFLHLVILKYTFVQHHALLAASVAVNVVELADTEKQQ